MQRASIAGRVSSPSPEDFSGSLAQYAFGRTTVNIWRVEAAKYERTQRDCSQFPSGFYSLHLIVNGQTEVVQNGRTAVVHQGDCFLADMDEPLQNQGSYTSLVLRLPPEQIKKWLPSPGDATAISFSKHTAWGNALAAAMGALAPPSLSDLPVPPHLVLEQIHCLLTLAVGPVEHTASEYKSLMLERFRQALLERFQEPELTPSMLAESLGVSKRTIHAVFSASASSFGQELLSLRMKHAKRLLANPIFDHKSIAEIALRVGYVHTSHFILRFRQTYGVTPHAYRLIRRM